jgi:biotin carboxyl carrier protein
MRYITTISGREFEVEILDDHHVQVNGEIFEVDFVSIAGRPLYSLLHQGKSFEAYVHPVENAWQVLLEGRSYPVFVEDEREKQMRVATSERSGVHADYHLKAPMPGLVVSVLVGEEQEVKKGDVLLILESMKMQNELKSPRAGKVARVRVQAGERVEQHDIMLSIVEE